MLPGKQGACGWPAPVEVRLAPVLLHDFAIEYRLASPVRSLCSVGWDPTGDRAARIRQAVADGLIRLGEQQAAPPAAAATQATVVQPSVHRPATQVTPAMHWTPQLRAAAGASSPPCATQVGNAGGGAPRAAAASVPASPAALSQAPVAAAARPRIGAGGAAAAAAAGKTPWQQLALDVAALLQPRGLSRAEVIGEIKRFQPERDAWIARGPRALAAEICRRLGKPPS